MAKLKKAGITEFKELINSEKFVIVYFYATWCAPCRAMNDAVEQLGEQLSGKIEVISIDLDKNKDLFIIFEVSSIPAVLLFYEGKVAERIVGYQPNQLLLEWTKTSVRRYLADEENAGSEDFDAGNGNGADDYQTADKEGESVDFESADNQDIAGDGFDTFDIQDEGIENETVDNPNDESDNGTSQGREW
ncbi:MAG: thioredoxin family protein [Clostridia bacterium]|nr:thioredoxin family protein [Clostridia bacterium]